MESARDGASDKGQSRQKRGKRREVMRRIDTNVCARNLETFVSTT